MSDCTLIREQMALLITESLDRASRENAHLHIESCAACEREWGATKETWRLLADAPDIPVPERLKSRFLGEVDRISGRETPKSNVVPFHRRKAFRWVAQAAAIALVAGGSYFAGSNRGLSGSLSQSSVASAAVSAPFRIAQDTELAAADLSPEINGSPLISNVSFIENAGKPGDVGMTFDLTSRVTVKGSPNDKSLVNLLAYVLKDRTHPSPGRSDAIEWVRDTYGSGSTTNPQIVDALANVLKNDTHEGMRLKAVETLRALPAASLGQSATQARQALIEALRNDPNPAVRIKAVEALMNLTASGDTFDPATVETLRQKAAQNDENPYVRVKAAEALSQLNL